MGPTNPHIQRVVRISPPRVKRPGRKAFQSPPSTAQFGNASIAELYCCSHDRLHGVHQNNFAFALIQGAQSFRVRLWQILVFVPMAAHPSSHKIYNRGIFSPGVQRPMCVAYHSTLSTAEVTNAWRFISTTPVHLLGRSNAAVSPDTCRRGYTPLK
jgi:hypothetical protein